MPCKTTISNPRIVLQDGAGKNKMCFLNPTRAKITQIRVDDCLIKTGKRCDFMLVDHNQIDYFIELKGKEVSYACSQLEETIKQLGTNNARHSYVVSSACPLTTTEVQILKAKFRKKFSSSLTVKNKFCEHTIK